MPPTLSSSKTAPRSPLKNVPQNSPKILKRTKHARIPCVKSKILQEIFDFVIIDGEKYAICKSCKENPKLKMTNSNTTGVKRHVQRFHGKHYEEAYLNSNSQNDERPRYSFVQEEFSKMIVEWLSLKNLPFDFFDDELTQSLFSYLNPNAILHKRTALKADVLCTFNKMKKAIKKIVANLKSKFSFTVNKWTSVGTKFYYCITLHFIDENWEFHSIVLSFLPSYGKHCGRDIANIFHDILQEFNLCEKLQGITVDNAAANSNFMEELKKLLKDANNVDFSIEHQQFRCLGDVFNLGVQRILRSLGADEADEDFYKQGKADDKAEEFVEEGLESIKQLTVLEKLRSLFKKIKRSKMLQAKLKDCCEAFSITAIETISDFCTMWDATYSIIKAAIHLKSALILLCEKNSDKLGSLILEPSDWTLIAEVFNILRNFKIISTALGSDKYETVPMAVNAFNILLDKLDSEILRLDTKEDLNITDVVFQSALKASRNKILEHFCKSNWVYCVALILDPRCKTDIFKFTSWGKELEKYAIQKFEDLYKTNYYYKSEPQDNQDDTVFGEIGTKDNDVIDLKSLFEPGCSSMPPGEMWRKEIKDYVSTKRAESSQDILRWWKQHVPLYPNLSRMAADILSISATSVPADRLFSSASLAIRKDQQNLESDSVEFVLCINSWVTCTLSKQIRDMLKIDE